MLECYVINMIKKEHLVIFLSLFLGQSLVWNDECVFRFTSKSKDKKIFYSIYSFIYYILYTFSTIVHTKIGTWNAITETWQSISLCLQVFNSKPYTFLYIRHKIQNLNVLCSFRKQHQSQCQALFTNWQHLLLTGVIVDLQIRALSEMKRPQLSSPVVEISEGKWQTLKVEE